MYKVDLHTHSIASPDGGLSIAHYKQALDSGLLDYIAVTDHNRIDYGLLAKQELGDRIIVGEEITTEVGEVIGLFLTEPIAPRISLTDTLAAIDQQGGITYVPHPFETVRKGLHPADLESVVSQVDMIEVCNGRAFAQNRAAQALVWARLNKIPGAASSDAHGYRGLGRTYTQIKQPPTAQNLIKQLAAANLITDRPGIRALLYPTYHRLRKRLRGNSG